MDDERVTLFRFPYLDHHLSTFLAKNGELTCLMSGVLTGDNGERRSAARRGQTRAAAVLLPQVRSRFATAGHGSARRT